MDLQIFSNKEFGEIRSLLINEEPWFIASDIANILGYSETSVMSRRLDNEEMTKIAPTEKRTGCLKRSDFYEHV